MMAGIAFVVIMLFFGAVSGWYDAGQNIKAQKKGENSNDS